MKDKNSSVSAVIIARNEQATVGKVVRETIKVLSREASKYEILVNDDASTDKTGEILDTLSLKHPFIKVYHQEKPLGIASGLEFLYSKAKYQLVVTNSGDGEYDINDFTGLLEGIKGGYDLIIGKRNQKFQHNLVRRLISFCFNTLPRILFGVDLYDAGSMKLYKRRVLRDTTPSSESVFNEAERIIRAYRLGYKVNFVPIKYFSRRERRSSGAKFSLIIDSLKDMLRLYFLQGSLPSKHTRESLIKNKLRLYNTGYED